MFSMRFKVFVFAATLFFLYACSSDKAESADNGQSEYADEEFQDYDAVEKPESEKDQESHDEENFPPFEENCEYFGAECGKITTSSGELNCGNCPEDMQCGKNNLRNLCVKDVCKRAYCWVSPYPQGDPVSSMDFSENGDMFFVSDANVFRKRDGKYEILSYQLRSGGRFTSIISFGNEDVWASATDGSLLELKDGFMDCQDSDGEYHSPVKNRINELAGNSSDNIYAASSAGVLHYDGDRWIVDHETEAALNTLAVNDEGFVVAAGDDGFVSVKKDGEWTDSEIEGDVLSLVYSENKGFTALVLKQKSTEVLKINSAGEAKFMYELDGDFTKITHFEGNIVAGGRNGLMAVDKKVINYGIKRDINGFKIHGKKLHIYGSSGWLAFFDGEKLVSGQGFFNGKADALFAMSPDSIWIAIDNTIVHLLPSQVEYYYFDSAVKEIFGVSEDEIYALSEDRVYVFNGFVWRETEKPSEARMDEMKNFVKEHISLEENSISWKFSDKYSFEHSCENDFSCTISVIDNKGEVKKLSVWPSVMPDGIPVSSVFTGEDSFVSAAGNAVVYFQKDSFEQKHTDFEITAVDSDGKNTAAGDNEGNIYIIDENMKKAVFLTEVQSRVDSVSMESPERTAAVAGGFMWIKKDDSFEKIDLKTENALNSVKLFPKKGFVAAGFNVVVISDGDEISEAPPGELVERGLPAGETEVDMKEIFLIDSDNIWITGSSPDGKTSYIFSYDGEKWINDARSSLYSEFSFTDVWACDQQNTLISMDHKGWIYHYKNMDTHGFIESVDNLMGSPVYKISGDPVGKILLFGENGIVLERESLCK